MKKTGFEIMDVTCRDGSYAVNFQISTSDEKHICKGLEDLGYRYVEIGHGMGVGTHRTGSGGALHTDEEYLCCARDNLKTIRYGVFCIPGIAMPEDVSMASHYGCSFIRIGCNVEDIDSTEDYIKEAKRHNLMVMSNYMKSYASTKEQFSEAARKSEAWGADLVYIVDSAGSMLPDDIDRYYEIIRDHTALKVGFHGHNNIGMALANSLHAVRLGVDFVDCSLQGLGRSSGNTALETFTICLNKMNYETGVDEIDLLLFSRQYVYPLLKKKGIDPIDAECGAAGFHSSYVHQIHKVSAEFDVNPLRLIREYCRFDQVNMDINKLREIASDLPKDNGDIRLYDFTDYFGEEQ